MTSEEEISMPRVYSVVRLLFIHAAKIAHTNNHEKKRINKPPMVVDKGLLKYVFWEEWNLFRKEVTAGARSSEGHFVS